MSTLPERGRCSCAASAKDVLSKPADRGGPTPVIIKELGLVTASQTQISALPSFASWLQRCAQPVTRGSPSPAALWVQGAGNALWPCHASWTELLTGVKSGSSPSRNTTNDI